MDAEKCVICGRIIPEGYQVCAYCKGSVSMVGALMQSRNDSEEEVKETYNTLKGQMLEEQRNEEN